MSLPGAADQSRKIGTKWDLVIKQLRENHRKLMSKSHASSDEIQVFNSFNKTEVKTQLLMYLNNLPPLLKTSSKLSEEIRMEGNKIYKQLGNNANLFEAIFLYSLALKCCESQADFAFCHGNRAAALIRIGFLEVARNDCLQAIRFQHPDKFKIYERLCLLSNDSVQEMRKNLAGLEKHLLKKASKQSREIVQQYKIRLKAMEKEKYVEELPDVDKIKLEDDGELKIKQMQSTQEGRYVIAQKSIAKDEKIFTEMPFAFVPVHNFGMKKYFNSDCENCGLVNIWPFLCLECRMASYCSPKCCEEHQKFHKYECAGYKINLWFEIGIAHLAFRCLLVGFPSLIRKLQSFDKSELKNKPGKIFKKLVLLCNEKHNDYFLSSDDGGADDFNAYAKVIGLLPNLFRKNEFPIRNAPYALTAQMLTIYLRERTTFFQDHITKETNLLDKNSDWDSLVGALILRHIGQLVSNGHAIIDFRQNIFTTESLKLMLLKNQANGGGLHLLLKSQRVFTGIFPGVSMLNHSCSPNIRNVFDGKKLTIFASEEVAEGGEVFNCYGPNYKLMSYQERQDALRLQYNFICKCTKCQERNDEYRFNNSVLCRFCNQRLYYPDKQILDDDEDEDESCENYLLKCQDCNKVHENEAMKAFFTLLAQQTEENRPITMDQVFENYVKAVRGFGTLDEIRFHMTEMMLHTLITNRDAIKFQNASIPLELAIELMNVKEELYGAKSIEFVGASLFFLDVISILTDKGIFNEFSPNTIDFEPMKKVLEAVDSCSSNIREIVRDYIDRYCYACSGD